MSYLEFAAARAGVPYFPQHCRPVSLKPAPRAVRRSTDTRLLFRALDNCLRTPRRVLP